MSALRDEQIFITEVGLTCSLGRGLPAVMDALQAQACGLSLLDVHGYPTAVGRVEHVLAVDEAWLATRDRATHLALDAVAQTSGLKAYDAQRVGVFWGVGLAGAHWLEATYQQYFADLGDSRLSPWAIPAIMPNATASTIAMKYDVQGGCWTIANACASSALALGQAMQAIRAGQLDAAIVGGSEAMLVPGMLHTWARMRVLARSTGKDAWHVCQPFDEQRNGLCLAEGAACLILEKGQHMTRTRSKPLAQLTGFGQSCDAMDMTEPSVAGQVRAMKQALIDAQLRPSDIGYLNAHATGTRKGDQVELMAVKDVALNCPVSSVKGALGHTMGASGAIEAAICVGVLDRSWIPPTYALTVPDAEFSGLCLPAGNGIRAPELMHVMSNSFGFGGTNASLVISRVDPDF
jgi:3-oxoacyl-[acyl-carrier-protein] synthase II